VADEGIAAFGMFSRSAEGLPGPASVALSSTIYNFDIDLADADRQVYETLALRVARHPPESEPYLLTRVLA